MLKKKINKHNEIVNPKISIITVSYNAADTIDATIKSVISQDYQNFEYLIIDGGSTDGTADIIKKYSDKIAYWISEPDKGLYDAMNKGVKFVTGDYVYFIGADDILRPNILTEIFNTPFLKHEIIYGNVKLVPDNIIWNGKLNAAKLTRLNFPHQALFYPKAVFMKYSYKHKYPIYADYFLNLQLWKDRNYKFRFINKIVCDFASGGMSTIKTDIQFQSDLRYNIEHYIGKKYFLYYRLYNYLTRIKNAIKNIK